MPFILQNLKAVLKPDGYVLIRDYAFGDFAQVKLQGRNQMIGVSFYVRVLILFLWRFPVNPLSWSWLQHCRYQYLSETIQESFSGYNHESVSFLVSFFLYVICFLFFVFVFAAFWTVTFITRRWTRAIFNNVNKQLPQCCSNSRS